MGDVFDAMNRSKRERSGSTGAAPTEAPTPVPLGAEPAPEVPALPLDQVAAAPIGAPPAPTPTPGGARGPVAAAAQKAQAEQQALQREAGEAAPAKTGATPQNGYAPEIVVHHDRGCVVTEQYRAIRTQILARSRSRRLQTHVLTSSAPEEGKTVTCLNLGVAFSELRNQKTLLIEADLRRPSFHKLFGREIKPGLANILRGDVDDMDQVIHPSVYDNLQFIPAGERESVHSTELLSSPRMAQLLDRLKDRYDHIFIDSPPVVTVTDPCILGAMCDQTLLVVRLNKTPSDVIERAKRLLRAANCEVAGVILTHNSLEISRYLYRYGYGRYYNYSYGRDK